MAASGRSETWLCSKKPATECPQPGKATIRGPTPLIARIVSAAGRPNKDLGLNFRRFNHQRSGYLLSDNLELNLAAARRELNSEVQLISYLAPVA